MNVEEIVLEIYNKYGGDVYTKVLSIAMRQGNYRFESNGRPLDYTIKLTENGEEEVRNCYEAIKYFEKKDYEYLLDNLTQYRSSLDVSVKFKIDYIALIPNSNFDTIEKVEKYINNNIREIVHDVVVRGGLVEAYKSQNQEDINGSEQFIKSELSKEGIVLEELTIRNIKEITDKFPAKQKEDLIDEKTSIQKEDLELESTFDAVIDDDIKPEILNSNENQKNNNNSSFLNQQYEILKRQRAVTDAQRSRVGAAVCAGICIIGTVAAIIAQEKLGVTNIQQVVQHELGSIYSFESLANYFKDIGPLTTLLAVGSMGAIAKYFNKNKKLRLAHNDLIDYNQALIDANNIELGSDENARTR